MKKSMKYRISIITSWVAYAAVQSQKAFSAYFTSEQILPIAIAGENSGERESNLKSVNKSH